MPQVFEEADALLISLKDTDVFSKTIPAKLQAYMMAGKPVIGMVNSEAADLINEARCGFTCDAGDHEGLVSITEAFLALASEERQKMGFPPENTRKRTSPDLFSLIKWKQSLKPRAGQKVKRANEDTCYRRKRFIGRHLCLALLQSGHDVRAVVRSPSQVTTRLASAGVDTIFSDLGDGPIDSQLFDDICCVIHCAGMAHIPLSDDDGAMVRRCKIINEDVPLDVFHACEANGVARFVFLSSSKVHGEFTAPGQSLTSASPYEPVDAYAISKYNAEKEFKKLLTAGPRHLS